MSWIKTIAPKEAGGPLLQEFKGQLNESAQFATF